MQIYEITRFQTGEARGGVNFLDPEDAFNTFINGFIHRGVFQSRRGFAQFGNHLTSVAYPDTTRVMGIFNDTYPTLEGVLKELLVFTKRYLYRYTAAGAFQRVEGIPGAGGTGPPVALDFNAGATVLDSDYVSCVSYLTGTGTRRVVFCSRGMSAIYSYDGVGIKYFNVANADNNPAYQAPAAGAFTKASQCFFFDSRINFVAPVIGGAIDLQRILYSANRNVAGNGDKFNTTGSGKHGASTTEELMGFNHLSNKITLHYQQSQWVLEPTSNNINPYVIRQVPSPIGTDSSFSPTRWGYSVKSIGRTGCIETDGRQSLRFDTRIPLFTTNDMHQHHFNLVYGGYDRITGQFLFSYRSSTSNLAEVTQDRVLVYNYEEKTWSVYDERFTVFGGTEAGIDLPMGDIDETHNPSWARMDSTEELWGKIGLGEAVYKTLAGDNHGFVWQLNQDCDDYFVTISNITSANPAVITCAGSPFVVGDEVQIENVTSMTQINSDLDEPATYVVTAVSPDLTNITINLDTSSAVLFTPYALTPPATYDGTLSKPIYFEAELAPFNPFREHGRRCFISHIEFLVDTDVPPFLVVITVDEQFNHLKTARMECSEAKADQQSREWLSMTVNQEADFFTISMLSTSGSRRIKMTSIRIHCKAAGLTTQ